MVKVILKHKMAVILLILTAFLIIVSVLFIMKNRNNLSESIYSYCQDNDLVKISDLTDFDWDIAYIDYERYGIGNQLKNMYHIDGDFKALESDNLFRIAFCKNNKLVYDLILNKNNIEVNSLIEFIGSGTVLSVKWSSESDGSKKLHLLQESLTTSANRYN